MHMLEYNLKSTKWIAIICLLQMHIVWKHCYDFDFTEVYKLMIRYLNVIKEDVASCIVVNIQYENMSIQYLHCFVS
jgi:hypothetical protein